MHYAGKSYVRSVGNVFAKDVIAVFQKEGDKDELEILTAYYKNDELQARVNISIIPQNGTEVNIEEKTYDMDNPEFKIQFSIYQSRHTDPKYYYCPNSGGNKYNGSAVNPKGSITITSIDETNKVIKGTFTVTAYQDSFGFSKDFADKLLITNGEFDGVYVVNPMAGTFE